MSASNEDLQRLAELLRDLAANIGDAETARVIADDADDLAQEIAHKVNEEAR